MKYSVHLPIIGFTDAPFSLDNLIELTRAAVRLGFSGIAANDHMVFGRPWLDGLTALAAVLPESDGLNLATTVSLPVVRHPVVLAKALAAIDVLSGGRVVAAVGPGSSARDYAATGLDFEERWRRCDESLQVLRSLLQPGVPAFAGRFYSTPEPALLPRPVRPEGIPLWVGSWGSEAGLRRTVRSDGWLASTYNTTPPQFAEAWQTLQAALDKAGRNAGTFPNALATGVMYVTEDEAERERVLRDLVSPALNRGADYLRDRVLVGSVAYVTDLVGRYREAGLQELYLWPVADEVEQVERFAVDVAPRAGG